MEIEKKLKEFMPGMRFKHSVRVKNIAVELAKINGCSREKAAVASLLHDVARDIPIENMLKILKEDGFFLHSHGIPVGNPLLLHAHAGKVMAKKQFGVHDKEVLRSIELHTTGGESMSLLDKVIFVADYIEPGRSFRGVKAVRNLAFKNMDKAVLYIFKFLIRNLLKRELFICKTTLLGYNELVLKCSGHYGDESLLRDNFNY